MFYFRISRRKYYTLSTDTNGNASSEQCRVDFNSVRKIHVQSEKNIIACPYYFPKAHELCFAYRFPSTYTSLASLLSRIVSPTHLTKLVVHCEYLSIKEIIDLLDCAPHVHTLVFRSMTLFKRSYLSIAQNEQFRRVSETNVITHITCIDPCNFNDVELLVSLCSRVQYLSICLHYKAAEGDSIIRFLVSRTNLHTSRLCTICIQKSGEVWRNRVRSLLKSERLLDDYSLRLIYTELYLWW